MNYFELFDLPFAPSIDPAMISRKYHQLQKSFHPDFHSQSSEQEKEDMLQQSASVNKAYKIFRDTDLTLAYFLEVAGVITTDEKYNLPPDFLMEMMELNETLTEDPELATSQVKDFQKNLLEEVKPLIENYRSDVTDDAGLQQLKAYYYKKKYLNRILDRLAD